MEGNHFVQWDYQGQDGRFDYLETAGGPASLSVPDSPGYQQIIGDRTSLPGSPRYPMGPSSPGLSHASDLQDPYGHATYTHYADEEVRRRHDLVQLAQAKVVLLGSVAAGKTSLLNTLRYGKSGLVEEGPEGRTIGIEVHSVALKPDTKLWFYDFGGHDTYHFSQQLFLTQRAIYLLAVDISIYDPAVFEKTLKHWYTILTSRLVTPVICLLATHIDLCHDKEAMAYHCQDMHDKLTHMEETHRRTLENELQMLKKEIMSDDSDDVESIRKFQPRTLRQPIQRLNLLLTNRPKVFSSVCCISSKTLEGIDQFRENLVSIVTDNESLFPQKDVPGSWIELSDAIVSKKDDIPFVTMVEFIDLAQQFSIVGDHVQKVLAYLQSVGLVLHYQDYRQNSDLSKYVFVNPNLLLAIFGLVFNHNYFMDETRFVWKHQSILRLPPFDFLHLRKNLKERGIIGEKLLKCFWDAMGISDEVYQAIVPLLEKFDLCYEIRIKPGDAVVEGRHFLFPYLLNKRKPQEVNFMWSDDLLDNFMQCGVELCFSQPNLPFGFLEKVLIRAHTYVDHCLSWKQGMVAFCDEGQDLVRIETKTDSQGNAYVVLSARVRLDRKSMARHIILLLVAVTNRVLLHHYPGIVAYWYCQCAHCLVKSLDEKYTEVTIDRFPADNIVYSSPGDTTCIQCMNCGPGQTLRLDEIFPRETDDIHSLKRLMSEPCCRALKSSAPALIKHMNYRDVMNALLRKQLLNIKQAEIIGSKPNHEERAQQLLVFMTQSDQKAFEVLCDELKQNDETAWLAEELCVKSAGRNSAMMKSRDSDSVGSSTLRGASAGWRGSQASQGSGTNTSVSNWSTYSRTSYGSTGSYIRRPYGSYITREPVQNYKRPSSTSSTPQQQRKESATAPPSRAPELATATAVMLRKQADHVRKAAKVSVTEQSSVMEYEKKRLSHIIEFSQEDLSNPATRPARVVSGDDAPTTISEVEVPMPAFVLTSAPQIYGQEPSRNAIDMHQQMIVHQNNVNSCAVPQPAEPNYVECQKDNQPLNDEPDIHSHIEFRQSQEHSGYEPTHAHYKKGSKLMDYTQSSQYETDIDADIALEHRQSNGIHHQQVYQEEAVQEVKKHSEPPIQIEPKQEQLQQQHQQLPEPEPEPVLKPEKEQQNQLLQLQVQHHDHQQQQQQQHSNQHLQQQIPQLLQQAEQQAQHEKHQPEEQKLLEYQVQSENQLPQQPQSQHHSQKEQLHYGLKHIPAEHQTWQQQPHHEYASQQQSSQYPQKAQQQSNSTKPDNDQKLDPTSIIYKETDLDGPLDQPQMPRDIWVRSTGDILGEVQWEPSPYQPVADQGDMLPQGRVNEHPANERGRPKSRSVVGLIGSADLGPTHVLQDMDPIELPLRPIKRSRSTSLNKSLRRPKSKSPQKENQEDRPHTWAVPYDWEQHNSMESLHRGCPRRQSGGFIFAASTLDVRSSTKRSTSSQQVVYSSQPSLNANEGKYSMPRPTGKKAGKLPQHDYVEPLPLPAEFIMPQSAPVQRRQPQFSPQGILPAQNTIQGKPPLPGSRQGQGPNPGSDRLPVMNQQRQQPLTAPGSRIGSVRQNLQGRILPSHPQVQQVRQSEIPHSSKLSDSSDATESYHTGRSRIGSNESDDATITSDISELTVESFHTTGSHNPSISSRALSHGSYISDRTVDSYHTGRSYANSDIPDDVTITSDVSELTIDSFHTFNNGMPPSSVGVTSPNNVDLTMVSQISNVTLNSFKSCRLSDDDVTLTSDGSCSPVPFAIDDTPNKYPMRTSSAVSFSQPFSQQGPNNRRPQIQPPGPPPGSPPSPPPGLPPGPPPGPPPSLPVNRQPHYAFILQSEENAPPVPPRKDLINQAPPIPARPVNAPPGIPHQRPHVTFADESHSQEELRVGAPASRVKEAKTVPLPRTDPQWSPNAASASEPDNKKDKKSKKKKKEKKSKKTLLPYVGTTPDYDKAVRIQTGNGHPKHRQQPQQPQRNLGPQFGPGPFGTNIDNRFLNNNAPVGEIRKDVAQNYVESFGPQHRGGRMPPPLHQQVYTVHAQGHPQMDYRQMSMRVDPRLSQQPQQAQGPHDHSKPHAYVQPYMHGANAPRGMQLDNMNSNNGNKPPTGQDHGGTYPYKGGNGNGIVLVEEPYVSSREVNANNAPYPQPPMPEHQSLRHPPHGGDTGLGASSHVGAGGVLVSIPRMGTQSPSRREGRPGDRNSTASSQDAPLFLTGSHDTAV